MSLNWREIDAILAELPLLDAFIRKVDQPDFRSLVLSCYHRGTAYAVLVSVEPTACRIHRIQRMPPRPGRAQRFVQLLRSRIQGGKIVAVEHVNRDRIVRLSVRQGGETNHLWIRLWGTAANIILTDAQSTILDAFFRRPGRNEVSGARFEPPTPAPTAASAFPASDRRQEFAVRDLPGEGDFNERIERWYAAQARQRRLELARERLRRQLQRRRERLEQRLSAVTQKRETAEDSDSWRKLGDLLMANLHQVPPGTEWVTVDDYDSPGSKVSIQLDPHLSPAQNAEQYYNRHKHARSGADRAAEETTNLRRSIEQLNRALATIDQVEDPEALEEQLERPGEEQRAQRETAPGLSFESHGFRILVGRTAKENDVLLRRFVRGNDTWLHARDYPGAYVFIKQQPGKSVPLDVLLDAGNLALAYSRARGDGDVYYTQVKYLRRAKHGKTGMVIPTQEKNLSVRLDDARLQRLKGAPIAVAGVGADGTGDNAGKSRANR